MTKLEELSIKYLNKNFRNFQINEVDELEIELSNITNNDINSIDDANKYLLLLKSFRQATMAANKWNGEKFNEWLKETLSVGSGGMYSDNIRFLFELIQNVDDCNYNKANVCNLRISFDNTTKKEKMILEYNEDGFTAENVFAITGIANSSKFNSQNSVQIGEKGIGFKSVFGIAEKVWIQSGYYSFELYTDEDSFTVPIPKYENYKPVNGTIMKLYLKPNKAEEICKELITDYNEVNVLLNNNPILFLNKINKLEIIFDETRSIRFIVTNKRRNYDGYTPRESMTISFCKNNTIKNTIKCLRYVMPIKYNLEEYKSRFHEEPKGNKRYYAFCVLPYPNYLDDVQNGSLYSFLPTQIQLNIPLAIHAPFKLKVSRENIDDQEKNAWFIKTCEAVGELLQRMFLDFARIAKGNIIKYLPTKQNNSIFEQINNKVLCESKEFSVIRFLNLPLYWVISNQLLYNTDVISINPKEVNDKKEMELVYKLIRGKKTLFLYPIDTTKKQLENINVEVISDINKKVFEQAFYSKEVTKEALKYLSDKYNKREEFKTSDIESLNKFELDFSQLKEFISYKEFLNLLQKYSSKSLNKDSKLNKLYLNKCSELENATIINDKYYKELDIESAHEYIINYLNTIKHILIIKSNDNCEQFYICFKNVLILSEDYKGSFAELRRAFNPKDFYSAIIRMEEKSNEIFNFENNPNITLLDFLKELSQLRRATKSILGKDNYRKYTDLILDSGKDSKRFIKELLQNADDCDFPTDVKPTFVLDYKQSEKSKIIYTVCNEDGFTKSNIRAITAIGESTKKKILGDNSEKTGEKGVGFKTVFGIAKEVTIRSKDIYFKLTQDEPTIPTSFQKVNIINGTEMEFLLKDNYELSNLTEKEILQLCVCLHNLKEIRINNYKVTINDNELERQIKINDKIYTLIKNIYPFEVNDNSILAERSKNGIKKINKNQNIYCYFFKNGNPDGFECKLYSSLATNITIYNNLIIDAPFELTTSRDEIIQNRWNEIIRNQVYNAIIDTLEKNKSIINKNLLRYIKINEQCNSNISSDNWLNNFYYLNLLKDCKILPTYADNVFVSPSEKCKLVPSVVKYLLEKSEEPDIERDKIINLSVPRENIIFNALEFNYIEDKKVLSLIEPYINKYILDVNFREKIYSYLMYLNNNELIPLIKNLNIFPVYSQDGKFIHYIKWQDNIHTEKDSHKSGTNYFVLNENILTKDGCEKILGNIRIKEMCFDLIKSNYNNMLYNKIVNEMTPEKAYSYILEEFNNGNIEKYEAKYTTVKKLFEEYKLPLKNVLGEYIVGEPLFIDYEDSFPFCNTLRKITLASEAISFVKYCLNYNKNLYEIHYDDLWCLDENPKKMLTCDDIEAFYSDYFKNKYEIMRNFIQNNYVSDELIEKYNLDYFSNEYNYSENSEEEKYEFPNSDIIDFNSLHKSYLKRFENPEKIIIEQVIREVKKVNYKGKLSEINSDAIRKETIDRYSVSSGECFCQFCEELKPRKFIEVNNIEREPEYYWKEMRIALCLECSKEFESIRRNDLLYKDFIKEILSKDLKNGNGPVEVEIGAKDGDSIKFSRQHLAEIQEILKLQQNKSNLEDKEK